MLEREDVLVGKQLGQLTLQLRVLVKESGEDTVGHATNQLHAWQPADRVHRTAETRDGIRVFLCPLLPGVGSDAA